MQTEINAAGTSSELEIELTYLPRALPMEVVSDDYVAVRDFYFPETLSVHPRLRLRDSGGIYSLTKKLPVVEGDASQHREFTVLLDAGEFEALTRDCRRTVLKRRYATSIEGWECEVDVFEGDLSGLVLIDFEFPDVEARQRFRAPAICLADVTQEAAIAGGRLAGLTYNDVAGRLESYGYSPVAFPHD